MPFSEFGGVQSVAILLNRETSQLYPCWFVILDKVLKSLGASTSSSQNTPACQSCEDKAVHT